MVLRLRSALFFILILLIAPISTAHALNLSVVGGLNRYHPSTNPDPPSGSTFSPKSAFDFGALIDLPIDDRYRFETGVIRHTRTNLLDDATTSTESSYRGWLVPLTIRFMRADFLGFGFGPYLAFLNARTTSKTTYLNGTGTSSSQYDNVTLKNFEVGLRINLRLAFPVWGNIKALFDGSYLLGFTDINTSRVAEDKNQELLFLVGFQIPLTTESVSSPSAESAASQTLKTNAPSPGEKP